ncbi:MAG: UDP-N-acetylmuramate dehydrogenase [Planctomycetes bacterium]|nr:UDP-N-acetylmuramate dehydrogenase [Planctomycetota bacterium]
MIKTKGLPIQSNVPIAELTTIATRGTVKSLAKPRNTDELVSLLKYAHDENINFHIIGKGSNVIIREDNDSLFICTSEMKSYSIKNNELIADAGASLSMLINITVSKNFSCLETLWGIPASIGGSCYMNAGGRFGEICNNLTRVTIVNEELQVKQIQKNELKYGYRTGGLKKGSIITQACFSLNKQEPKRLKERLDEVKSYKISTQPLKENSSGCIFKNPNGLSAANLIEQAGLKNARVNDAVVSTKHSNFIINEENATTSDLLSLIEIIRNKIFGMFKIDLEMEVEILK